MRWRTLVTGFLAFDGIPVNPSALLAESCGRPHVLIEVSFEAVNAFIERFDSSAFDRLVLLGVRGSGSRIELERVARNEVGASPDVRGTVLGPAPIEPGAPAELAATLWHPSLDLPTSGDAGCYLCNYIFYRALWRLPAHVKIGFVHVPPLHVVPLEDQRRTLARLLEAIEQPAGSAVVSRA